MKSLTLSVMSSRAPAHRRGVTARRRWLRAGAGGRHTPKTRPLHPWRRIDGMKTSLQFFAGCPNWQVMEQRLGGALLREEIDPVRISLIEISSHEGALDLGFCGSPTVLIDGSESLAEPGAPIGLVCRLHRTDHGLSGSPTVDQLAASCQGGEEE